MIWVMLRGDPIEVLGIIPSFLNEADPKPAKEQIDDHYQHGGGWKPFKGHTLNMESKALEYPGDPPMFPIACTKLRDELILVYPHAWVLIIQPDKSWEVARID